MQWALSRRRVLATLSSATAAGLIGGARGVAQEAPPETTTVRLAKIPGICIAPMGPGVVNLMTGLGNAWADASPVIAIGGSALAVGPLWWLFWASLGLAGVGVLMSMAIGIFDDWY